ncbi:uncharacterized protein LOC144905815 [Branchiostoma floridae x Branchiostoma belcheri]
MFVEFAAAARVVKDVLLRPAPNSGLLASVAGTFVIKYLGYDYFKVPATGPMSSANVKVTCERAGYVTPCPGTRDCPRSSADCVLTGLIECGWPMLEVSQVLCGTDPRYCPALDGVYIFMANYQSGSSHGVENGVNVHGNDYYDRFAFCARVEVDECSSDPCQNGAVCQDGGNSFTCQCVPGYTGTLCEEIDECSSAPCHNGAVCQDGVNSFTCQCVPGYTGTLCETVIDDCASNPCWFGGTCVDGFMDFSCVCPKGFEGKKCEIAAFSGQCYQFSPDALSHAEARQACSTKNGHLADVKDGQQQSFIASSIAATTGASNWLGMKLEPVYALKYSDGSAAQDPLQLSAAHPTQWDFCVLLDSSNSFQAEPTSCTEHHNYICQSDLQSCGQHVCQNGGNCTSCFGDSIIFCDCPDGFGGKSCEINFNECASDPCQNGGTCHDDVNSYRCRCLPGYVGDNCESDVDWCSLVTCPFDWTCQDYGPHFTCLAPFVRLKEPYRCSSASCPDGMNCREDGASFSCWAN